MKVADLRKQNKPPNALFFGPAGSGKTGLVSQASGGYLFDFDDGMRTALELDDKFTPLRHAIEFDIFVDEVKVSGPSVQLVASKYIDAKTKLLSIANLIAADNWPFDACIIDSLTGLCRSAQLHVMSCQGNAFARPQIQHYGMIVNEVESILTMLRSLKVPTLVTAHEMLVETDAATLIRIMSATKPHGMNKLQWLFDEVLHSKVRPRGQGKIDYIVSGKSSSTVSVRTRSGINSDVVHNEIGLAGVLKLMGYEYGKKLKS